MKWENSDNDAGPLFRYVTISNTSETTTSTDYVDFVGSFSPVDLTANDNTVLYLGADNKLYYPSANRTVGACRAVFRLKGLVADAHATVRAFVLNFGEDSESTGILSTTNLTNYTNSDNAWYDLSGRKLSGKPSAKGLYFNNGHKVVIK